VINALDNQIVSNQIQDKIPLGSWFASYALWSRNNLFPLIKIMAFLWRKCDPESPETRSSPSDDHGKAAVHQRGSRATVESCLPRNRPYLWPGVDTERQVASRRGLGIETSMQQDRHRP
jgi:hypothetical protein